jgi:hypothetical protein
MVKINSLKDFESQLSLFTLLNVSSIYKHLNSIVKLILPARAKGILLGRHDDHRSGSCLKDIVRLNGKVDPSTNLQETISSRA